MTNFNTFPISEKLMGILPSLGYKEMTQVQEECIPLILEGNDILASSQTGSGKTGAFLIPLLSMIEKEKGKHILIITPTRELAKQVQTVANQMMGNNRNNEVPLLVGGNSIVQQFRQLKQNSRVIVGTPGRINDHLERGSLRLDRTSFLVLDETDRMLDMGFGVQIDAILKHMPQQRQTLLFSATLPKAIVKLSEKYLNNPVRVAIGKLNAIADKIAHDTIQTENKFDTLVCELEKTTGSVLIFVRTQRGADKMKEKFREHYLRFDVLHGGLRQSVRERVMRNFRAERTNVLIATDIAARGLDVPHIENVINYDLPDNPEDYIHRIGRTARADKTGKAISLLSKSDKLKWRAVERFLSGDEEDIKVNNNKSSERRSSRPFGDKKRRSEGSGAVKSKSRFSFRDRKSADGRADGRTGGRTDSRNDSRSDGRTSSRNGGRTNSRIGGKKTNFRNKVRY